MPSERSANPAIAVLTACLFVSLTCELFPVGAQPELAAGLSASRSEVGLLVTWFAVAAGAATLPSVWAAGRLDPRIALALGMLVLGGCQLGFASSTGIVAASLWRAGSALSHGLIWSQAPVIAARLTPPEQRGRTTSRVLLGASFGLLVGAPVSTALVQGLGWRAGSAVIGALALVAAAALLVILPRLAPVDRAAGTPPARPRWASIAVVCLATVVLVVGHYVSYAFLEPLSARVGLGGGLVVVVVLAGYGAAGLVGVWVVGGALDRRPRGASLIATALLLVGVLAVAVGSPVVAGLAVLAWGAGAGALPVWLNTAALRADPDRPDLASAAYVVAYQVGISAGAALGAAVLALGRLGALPLVSAAAVALSGVLVAVRRGEFGG